MLFCFVRLAAQDSAGAVSDSLWEIRNKQIQDSLRLHPYTGPFRFWMSDYNKFSPSEIIYVVNEDSIEIREGYMGSLYLRKADAKDVVTFKRALSDKEKAWLAAVGDTLAMGPLKKFYNNWCIMDGLMLGFRFESGSFSKDVTVWNKYNEKIGSVMRFINAVVPKKYQISYYKEMYAEFRDDCDK